MKYIYGKNNHSNMSSLENLIGKKYSLLTIYINEYQLCHQYYFLVAHIVTFSQSIENKLLSSTLHNTNIFMQLPVSLSPNR